MAHVGTPVPPVCVTGNGMGDTALFLGRSELKQAEREPYLAFSRWQVSFSCWVNLSLRADKLKGLSTAEDKS